MEIRENVGINARRLIETIAEAGKYGRRPPVKVYSRSELDETKGITRLTGTEADKMARDYVVKLMEDIGLKVRVDVVGNIYGRLEGSRYKTGTVMTGSHIDTVVNGGQFDGALGVFGAIEAVRSLIEEGFINDRPIEVVVFTAEEGSAFMPCLLGSSVLVGKLSIEEALSSVNREGVTLGEALERIGYRGNFVRSLDDVEYMVELHIEQGPILWSEGIPIGIVEGINGINWLKVTIKGEAGHAGTIPMRMRKDALVAAAEVITYVHRHAEEIGPTTLGTVGRMLVHPGGINIIPGLVELWIDIRDFDEDNVTKFRKDIEGLLAQIRQNRGVEISNESLVYLPPIALSKEVIDVIERVTGKLGLKSRRLKSGAGHDSQNLALKIKSGMIFVPSYKGISHSPLEWTDWDDVVAGVRVLKETIKVLSSIPLR